MQFKLIDIIDIDTLQKLLESFTESTGAVTAILDLEGNVLIATGWQDICTKFHRVNSGTSCRCLESDTYLAAQLEAGEKYNVYKCKNGLVDVAVPIMIADTHVGNLFTGQFLFAPPDQNYFRGQAIEFGIEEKPYLSALSRVPVFSMEEVEKTMNFLSQLAVTIGEMGISKLRLDREYAERKRVEEQLRQAQKMDAVGQLTGGIAHDFNNMLGIIMGNIEMLRRRVKDDSKALKHVENAYGGCERGVKIVKKLLSFSRDEPGKPQLIQVNEFIKDMENLIAKSLTAKITVETHLSDDIWYVNIDPSDLEDALLNLSLNARDAMPEGGNLIIESTNKYLDEYYVNGNPGSTMGEHVMLTVSDTGSGMSAEVIDKVFQPFFSTKEKGQGTGLGLSMVYGFIQRSGGHIKIYSEMGKGTTFRIYLPRVIEETEAPIPQIIYYPMRGDETILIVDDEENLLKVAVSFLEDLGYQTITAKNPNQALEILQSHKQIDLLFSDVVMPGTMDGYDLATKVIENYPNIKILLTSGFSSKWKKTLDSEETLIKQISDNLLSKPYNQVELSIAVRGAMDKELRTDNRERMEPAAN